MSSRDRIRYERDHPLYHADDPAPSLLATRLFERELTQTDCGFISVVTMAETLWVLERAYGASRATLAATIERLLSTDVLIVESEQAVFDAMLTVKDGVGSFADGLIAGLGARAGCTTTVTCDRKASRLNGFTLL